jgi:hypothetical protein
MDRFSSVLVIIDLIWRANSQKTIESLTRRGNEVKNTHDTEYFQIKHNK